MSSRARRAALRLRPRDRGLIARPDEGLVDVPDGQVKTAHRALADQAFPVTNFRGRHVEGSRLRRNGGGDFRLRTAQTPQLSDTAG